MRLAPLVHYCVNWTSWNWGALTMVIHLGESLLREPMENHLIGSPHAPRVTRQVGRRTLIGSKEDRRIGNVQIGHVQIGHVQIGHVQIGPMEDRLSVTLIEPMEDRYQIGPKEDRLSVTLIESMEDRYQNGPKEDRPNGPMAVWRSSGWSEPKVVRLLAHGWVFQHIGRDHVQIGYALFPRDHGDRDVLSFDHLDDHAPLMHGASLGLCGS